MTVWKVEITRRAYKQYKKLPNNIKDIIDEAISDIENQGPIPKFWNVKKIGNEGYRIRLNYRYRMRYTVEDEHLLIEVFYLGHRKDAY